jgi:Cofilin/tropomyosin-type actin-binding protein
MEFNTGVAKIIKEIREDKRWRYVIFKLRNGRIEVNRTGNLHCTYNNFISSMKHTYYEYRECRIGLFNIEYRKTYPGSDKYDSRQRVILIFLDSVMAPSRVRAQYYNAYTTLKANMPGIECFEGIRVKDVTIPVILSRLLKLD